MRVTRLKEAVLGLAALAFLASPVLAAPPPAAPVPPPTAPTPPAPAAAVAPAAPAAASANPDGPLVAGVCLLSQEDLIARSKVGQAATARLRELAQQAQANLTAEQARLQARGKALEAKRATLTPLQLEAEGKALNQRAQALQAEAGERSQQMEATKTRAYGEVVAQAKPFITQAYAAHGCGLLFERGAVITGNLGNDLTPTVLAALDAKGTPITFALEPPRPAK
jgi:Skp family chaperone for outer membrane proteins